MSQVASVDSIAISQHVAWRRLPRESLNELVRRPRGGWAAGHVDTQDSSTISCQTGYWGGTGRADRGRCVLDEITLRLETRYGLGPFPGPGYALKACLRNLPATSRQACGSLTLTTMRTSPKRWKRPT